MKKNEVPDLRSWWGLQGGSRAWCWGGGTGCDRTKDDRRMAPANAWSCHCTRLGLTPCAASPPWASRRGGTRWSLRRRSCISSSALSGSRPDLLSSPRTPFSLSLGYDTVSIPSEEMQWRRIVVEIFGVRSREYGREKEGSEFIERGSVKWERLRDRPRRSCHVSCTRGGIGRVGGCWCSILGLRTGDWHFGVIFK